MRYDEAKTAARATVGICPALILEDERDADGFLAYHLCGNRSHPEVAPYCGVHRSVKHWRSALRDESPQGEG